MDSSGRLTHKPTSRQVGQYWERKAESFLHRRGLTTRERNFNCRAGEIDLIMNDGNMLVFVEVRFRNNVAYGSGADTVSTRKQKRLTRAALYFLCRNPRFSLKPCRFDVISVGKSQGQTEFRWIRNAFESLSG